jgi:predicted DNA-binding protein with PD1-like motif
MKYTKGSIGRVFLVKFDDRDLLIDKLSELARKEKIKPATLIFLGALKKGILAAGPKKPVIPPQANKVSFKDGWEVMGIGTIFSNNSGPQLHIHCSMGKKKKVLTGCVGVRANKSADPKTGLNLLKIF